MRTIVCVVLIGMLAAPSLSTRLRSNPRLGAGLAIAAGILLAIASSSSTVYNFAKDFQPTLAATGAFCAALIAYLSAQHAAKIQAEVAATNTRLQLEATKRRDEFTDARKRKALAILASVTLAHAETDLKLRRHCLQSFHDKVVKDATDQVYDKSSNPLIWTLIGVSRLIVKEVLLFDVPWDTLGIIGPAEQASVYMAVSVISRSDQASASVANIISTNATLTTSHIEQAIELTNDALLVLADIQPSFDQLTRDTIKAG